MGTLQQDLDYQLELALLTVGDDGGLPPSMPFGKRGGYHHQAKISPAVSNPSGDTDLYSEHLQISPLTLTLTLTLASSAANWDSQTGCPKATARVVPR